MSNTMENPSQSTLAGHPVMLPPLGVQSDFDNPQTYRTTLIVLSIIFTTLAFIAVYFRLYARRRLPRQPFWWDDGICVAAMLASITNTTLIFINLNNGLGKHMWDIRLLSLTRQVLLVMIITNNVICICSYLVRLSLLLLYYRLFKISRSSRRLIWIGMALCTTITTSFLAVLLATLRIKGGPTPEANDQLVVFDVLNIVSDCYILMIPLRQMKQLSMDSARKRVLGVFLGLDSWRV
ncbi:hypothetical protein B0J14DRAFT_210540 [Halenospora varia]|nr:hypothetical protein B0J14DRAFT_210540 [Halenospora varia]